MAASKFPATVALALLPPDVRESRRALARNGWRESVTWMVALVELLALPVGVMLAVPFLPWMFHPATDLSAGSVLGALVVALAVLLAPLGLAEFVRQRWLVRRADLRVALAPYDRAVVDPRWRDTQALLLELRGPDDTSAQAEVVYRLTLSLAAAYLRRDRIAAAVRAALALGEDGAEHLSTLLRENDAALDAALVDVKRTCAVALRDSGEATRATRSLLVDLEARLTASAEVEGTSARVRAQATVKPPRPLRSFEP